jgi:hypothetical protein
VKWILRDDELPSLIALPFCHNLVKGNVAKRPSNQYRPYIARVHRFGHVAAVGTLSNGIVTLVRGHRPTLMNACQETSAMCKHDFIGEPLADLITFGSRKPLVHDVTVRRESGSVCRRHENRHGNQTLRSLHPSAICLGSERQTRQSIE